MRFLLIVAGLIVLAIAAHTDGGTVSTDRPFELGFYVIALIVLAIAATPSERRLAKELKRREQGKEVLDEVARTQSSEAPGQLYDWAGLADHQPGRSDQVRRAG